MIEILRSTPATLELEVYASGALTNLDANPTLVITDGAGVVVASGAVTKPGSTTGIYRSDLPSQANLKVLDAAWSGVLGGQALTFHQDYEIVGNLLFTEAEARSAPIVGSLPALADEVRYPDAVIASWRAVIGELFERRMNRGVVARYARVEASGAYTPLDLRTAAPKLANGQTMNRPGRAWDVSRIISATHDGDTIPTADLHVVDHTVYWPGETWTPALVGEAPLNVVLEYEYGPNPVWAEAHQRALDMLLANAAPKGFPSSATSISSEDGTFRITNFPVAVEEFLKAHNYRL